MSGGTFVCLHEISFFSRQSLLVSTTADLLLDAVLLLYLFMSYMLIMQCGPLNLLKINLCRRGQAYP